MFDGTGMKSSVADGDARDGRHEEDECAYTGGYVYYRDITRNIYESCSRIGG